MVVAAAGAGSQRPGTAQQRQAEKKRGRNTFFLHGKGRKEGAEEERRQANSITRDDDKRETTWLESDMQQR